MITQELQKALDLYNQALELYKQREWQQAKKVFVRMVGQHFFVNQEIS